MSSRLSFGARSKQIRIKRGSVSGQCHYDVKLAVAPVTRGRRGKCELGSKQLQRVLYINRMLGIVNGPKRGAEHGICVVLGDDERTLFNPFQ